MEGQPKRAGFLYSPHHSAFARSRAGEGRGAACGLPALIFGGKVDGGAGDRGKSRLGLAFQRMQLMRRQDKSTEAVKILLSAPTDPAKIVSPDDRWDERRANAYEALNADNYKLAYELVRDAGPLTVNPLKEQRFMAGWIAMRYLKAYDTALAHFKAMREVADGLWLQG